MKLASLKKGRDGELVLVSRDLRRAVTVSAWAKTLQQALDNWDTIAPRLEEVYHMLNEDELVDSFPFDPTKVSAPLPRAYQWADASAYVNHVELVRRSRGVEMPENFWTSPLMYQGGSDSFLGARDPILMQDDAWGIDFEAELAIITKDVPMGAGPKTTQSSIALLMLVNDVSLRNLAMTEIAKGFGFFLSKPSTAFSPVAITPDELKEAWDGHKVHLPITSHLNGKLFGKPNAGVDMTFDFPRLIQHAATTRPLSAGTIIGSGTVSNKDRSNGSSCLVEKRTLELLEGGKAITPFMTFGDTIRIEMFNEQNESLFGAIDQTVEKYEPKAP